MNMQQAKIARTKPWSNRSLAISQRQAQALLRAAQLERAIIEVGVGNQVYRLIPRCLANDLQRLDGSSRSETFVSLGEYREWKERNVADQG
jgi:hypothetical protein